MKFVLALPPAPAVIVAGQRGIGARWADSKLPNGWGPDNERSRRRKTGQAERNLE
jgi:hypothetical protein